MSAEVALDVVVEKKKNFESLEPSRLTFEDARFCRWSAVVPRDMDPEMLTESSYWLSNAQRLHSLDRVEVVWEDRSAMASLMCLEASQSYISMVVLSYQKLPGIISDGSEGLVNFEIFYSQLDGYCCRRLSDSAMVVKNATSREKAIEELKAHPSFSVE